MSKLKLALIFGGRSTEHEVSVITALQAYENIDLRKYEVIPIYESKQGDFYTSPKFLNLKNYKDLNSLLPSMTKIVFGNKNDRGGFYTVGLFPKFIAIDVALPLIHGSFGEDGSLQGVFETYQIPYVGFNVLGSAIGIDKLFSKYLFQSLGIPIGKFVSLKRVDFQNNPKKALEEIKKLRYPLIVKPGDIGSSIGVNKVDSPSDLEFNIEIALTYSDYCLVEVAFDFDNVIEVNCAALGYQNPLPSVCEQPLGKDATLSFTDKYQADGSKGGSKGSKGSGMASLSRIIPAPISKQLTKKIQDTTIKVFKALEGCGVARVDYFVDPKTEEFWINEINTIPGSQAFYLYRPLKISYKKLNDILIQLALERAKDQSKTQYTFESDLLSQMAQKGGAKS